MAPGDPRHWSFWEREALVYETGLAAVWQVDGIVAPTVAAVIRDGGGVDLWLEWVDGIPGERWDVDDYALAAGRLGVGQAKLAMKPARLHVRERWLPA